MVSQKLMHHVAFQQELYYFEKSVLVQLNGPVGRFREEENGERKRRKREEEKEKEKKNKKHKKKRKKKIE